MQPRTVSAMRGWSWIVEGCRLFLKSPAMWLALLVLLFACAKLLATLWLLALVLVLLIPVFIAGLMEGCRALEQGQELKVMHLACGFQKNAGQLVTLGGISFVGNLIVILIIFKLGGDAIGTMSKVMSATQITEEMRAAAAVLARAFLVAMLVSLPLLMALWYAPLLVYFHDLGTVAAMKSSFVACVKNTMPLMVYGLVIMVGMFVVLPLAQALGEPDLVLWLLAPIVVPSLYASYKDIYAAAAQPALQA
jgi:hypothetical protein